MNVDMNYVTDDTPLRPSIIAKIAFPDGSINERAIRKLMNNGKLDSFVIGNRKYSNLKSVKKMIEKMQETRL